MNPNAQWLYHLCLQSKQTTPLSLAKSTLELIRNTSISDDDGEWIGSSKMQAQRQLFELSKDPTFCYAVLDRFMELRRDETLTVESLVEVTEVEGAATSASATAKGVLKVDQVENHGDAVGAMNHHDDDMEEGDDDMEEGSRFSANETDANDESAIDLERDNDMEEGDLKSASSSAPEMNSNADKTDTNDESAIDLEYDNDMDEGDLSSAAENVRTLDAFAESQQIKSTTAGQDSSKDASHYKEQTIDHNELYRFQLRTKVLGLSIPSFTSELWRYLQLAGWTYVGGTYRPPKEKRSYSDSFQMAKQIFVEYNAHANTKDEESDITEEGPEIFDNANDIMEYLDQYCLPDYSLTPAQVQQEQQRLANHSKAYERRCKRLRYELLEIAFRERLREQNPYVEKDGSLKSMYGHNHRPCEVCFEGSSTKYPRVACRDCGLVVHTGCYGLKNYSGGKSNPKKVNDGREVDAKGYFQCDVCKVGPMEGAFSKKQLWNAPQDARWREYSHPTAICQLCDYQFIAGGMIRIQNEAAVSGSKRRRSRDNQETWVHVYCYNSLAAKGYNEMIRENPVEIIQQIGKTSSSSQNDCSYCIKDKGWTMACKKKCGNHFHPTCLQLELAKSGKMLGKVKTCEQCLANSGSDKFTSNELQDKIISSKVSSSENVPTNQPIQSMKADYYQYFKHPKKKKKQNNEAVEVKETIVIPPIHQSIAEARNVYAMEQCEAGFDTYELQYNGQFRNWAFLLSLGQSILMYGLGSKRDVMESFGDTLASEGNVVAINGYDAAMNLTDFLDILLQIISGEDETIPFDMSPDITTESESRREWLKKASYIAEKYSDDRPLFLLIHNIDGAKLSSLLAQEALATLTANSTRNGIPAIRIIASIDDVNRSMFWEPLTEHKFNWTWKLVHTYRPHFDEIERGPQEISEKKTKKMHSKKRVMSVKSVLLSLAPKHKDLVVLLANMQSRNQIVTYAELREACANNLVAANDSVIRAILRELRDHLIVEHGTVDDGRDEREVVFIPSDEMMHEILQFSVTA